MSKVKTHVHPETHSANDPLEDQFLAVHRDSSDCELTMCTYVFLTDEAKRESERIGFSLAVKQGMRDRAEAKAQTLAATDPSAELSPNLGYPRPTIEPREVTTLTVDEILSASTKHVLPASLRTVPSDEYGIAEYKELKGAPEGPAFEAKLTRNGKPVAELFYDGWGGDVRYTWLDVKFGENPYISAEMEAYKSWVDRFEGKWDAEYDLDWCVEGATSVLIEEVSLRKSLNGARTRTPYRLSTDTGANYRLISGPANGREEYLKKSHKGQTILLWDKTAGVWAMI